MEKKGKGAIAKSQGQGIVTAGHGCYFLNSSTSYANKKNGFSMPLHPLTNFEIQK